MKYILKNGYIVSPGNKLEGSLDIRVEDGKITEIAAGIGINDEKQGFDIIDISGLVVFPGLVDCHCHLRTPGYEYKEDLYTGSQSAAKGGFTSIACMPNTDPVIDNATVVEYILNKSKEDAVVNVYPIGSITKGQKGSELADIGELKFSGAVAISDDGKPVVSADIMMKAIQYAAMFDIAIISHCEEPTLSSGSANEGYISTITGLKGIPSASESIMVARELVLAAYLNLPVHIAHVSSALSVQLIREAKKRGVKVTCETCPQYFSLTDEAISRYDTNAKVNPPLKTEADRLAVIEGIKDGTIDIIATDHAPHNIDEKNVEFELASNGMTGFETAVSLALDILHHKNNISLSRLAMMMSRNPAILLSLNKGLIETGAVADLTIIDTEKISKTDTASFASKSKNSPFNGYTLKGTVKHTIVAGKFVVNDGILV